jgi:virginiamycin B lyase
MMTMVRIFVVMLILQSLAFGSGSISGAVTGSDGAPLKGVFVRIQNPQMKMTIHVLSNRQGRYRADNVPAGDYRVQATAAGYSSDVRTGVKVADNQSISLDFTVRKRPVRWTEITMNQFKTLAPADPGKDLLVNRCFACHGHQTQIATARRDFQGWLGTVNFMRDSQSGMGGFIGDSFTDEMAQTVASYMERLFGVDSAFPGPEQMPGYANTVHGEFTDEAMNIVYVDYDLGPSRFPWSGLPMKDGSIWMPYYGNGNKIAKLDPKTGVVQELKVPLPVSAGIHSVVPGPEDTFWFSEQYPNNVGKYDARTNTFKEYKSPGRGRHTILVDDEGIVWSTGSPLTRFNPKTEEFTVITDAASSYGVDLDKAGNLWYTEFRPDGKLGKVDRKTLAVTKYELPTPGGRPRRLEADAPDGAVWVLGFGSGVIARLDPQTGAFREYKVPGPEPTPYAFNFDRDGNAWYSSEYQDVYGRLNPRTGQIIEFPFPYAENSSREFFRDDEGRMWWASPPNNRVGYFYLAGDAR